MTSLFSNPMPVCAVQRPDEAHRMLAEWNARSWRPSAPARDWRESIAEDARMRVLEGEMMEHARADVAERALSAPKEAHAFAAWFASLQATGPGQHDPLFDWIERFATLEEVRWFVGQELSGEAGFEDLVACTQVKMPVQSKLELARNYWDEMGRGDSRAMHGPMLERLAVELDAKTELQATLVQPLALVNLMCAMASNRRYAWHSIGALGVIELTAPGRAAKVKAGLIRLNVRAQARQYFAVHEVLDVKHYEAWSREVLQPLVAEDPSRARWIAEGALIRLQCGQRCFEAYRGHLWHERASFRRAS